MPKDATLPASPPSPNATESELRLLGKREREVSVEPVTTPKAVVESDPLQRETRTPAKKNRRRLAPTDEEEDGTTTRSRSNSGSPPVCASPPQEMKIKVRQISQGVEDLSWRNMKAPVSEDIENDDSPPPPVENQQPVHPNAMQVSEPTAIKVDDESPPKSPADSQLSQSVSDLPSASASASVDNLTSEQTSRRMSDSDSGDKGLKRKFVERGTSQGPQENGDTSKSPSEPLKRPRDDADKDDNPRETKRPSPPPEPKSPKKTSPPSPKIPKLGGFSAYASTSSPFATVKGQNVFSKSSSPSSLSGSPSPSPFSPNANSIPTTSGLASAFGNKAGESSSTPLPTATKRTGFEAFASSASPFASVTRSKSPVLGSASKLNRNKSPPRRGGSTNSNPFASYAGELHGFAVPMSKRARAGSPDGSSRSSLERSSAPSALEGGSGGDSGAEEEEERHTSFGEKLRSTKDDDDDRSDEELKVKLTEQEVLTGEEEEETLTQARGKLFTLVNGNQWKERGTGLLKLNVKRDDGSGARLVMRKEAVYTLLLNITLFPGMKCIVSPQDPRYLRFSAIEEGVTIHYNLRVANAKIALDLLEEINANIPFA